jgi:uncharacterized protein (DUF4415 family)
MKEQITVRKLSDRRKGLTDWARIDAMTEEELDQAIAADPDSDPPVDWSKARFIVRKPKESVHLRVDPDVLAWFRKQGRGYLTRMNAVLRAYMEAHLPRESR